MEQNQIFVRLKIQSKLIKLYLDKVDLCALVRYWVIVCVKGQASQSVVSSKRTKSVYNITSEQMKLSFKSSISGMLQTAQQGQAGNPNKRNINYNITIESIVPIVQVCRRFDRLCITIVNRLIVKTTTKHRIFTAIHFLKYKCFISDRYLSYNHARNVVLLILK